MAATIKEALKALTKPGAKTIEPDVLKNVITAMVEGHATQAQIGAFLTALQMKGFDAAHVAAVVEVMLKHSLPCPVDNIVDIVGTGGDGLDTFNVSTASAIVCAGAGLRVAKHGNRASSSACGSADVLEALGAYLDIKPKDVPYVLDHSGFCFLFAQAFHPLMKSFSTARKEIGIRTIFNLLGPLINPAHPRAMVVGVYAPELGELVARTLLIRGLQHALVVCGAEGLDEFSPAGDTHVWEVRDGAVTYRTVHPSHVGLPTHPLTAVAGGGPKENAATFLALLDGEEGPILDYVLLNAGALCYVSGLADDFAAGVAKAREAIKSGAAKAALERYIAATNERRSH
eukprot:Colp12_sorted_trinity150504_noHs@2799